MAFLLKSDGFCILNDGSCIMKPRRRSASTSAWVKLRNSVSETRNFVSKIEAFRIKTRNFAFKLLNPAALLQYPTQGLPFHGGSPAPRSNEGWRPASLRFSTVFHGFPLFSTVFDGFRRFSTVFDWENDGISAEQWWKTGARSALMTLCSLGRVY